MSRARWTGRLAGSLAGRTSWLVAPVVATRAAPNPYGDRAPRPPRSCSTPTGAMTSRCGRPRSWSGSSSSPSAAAPTTVPAARRRGPAAALPAGRVRPDRVTVAEGQPRPADFTRINHLVSGLQPRHLPRGPARVRAQLPGDRCRPTDRARVDRCTSGCSMSSTPRATGCRSWPLRSRRRAQLRCVTFAPESEPCGTAGGSTLIDVFEDDRELGTHRSSWSRSRRTTPRYPSRRSTGASPRGGGGRARRAAGRG